MEISDPKQRTANIPAVMEIITNESPACDKINFSPSSIDRNTDAAANPVADSRSIATVITSPAEKKKLAQSNAKHAFGPSQAITSAIAAGATTCESCIACDINPFAATSPRSGVTVRTATDCAGMKKLETQLSSTSVP